MYTMHASFNVKSCESHNKWNSIKHANMVFSWIVFFPNILEKITDEKKENISLLNTLQ